MLIRSVETFLRRHRMPPTKFGRLAAHDENNAGKAEQEARELGIPILNQNRFLGLIGYHRR